MKKLGIDWYTPMTECQLICEWFLACIRLNVYKFEEAILS